MKPPPSHPAPRHRRHVLRAALALTGAVALTGTGCSAGDPHRDHGSPAPGASAGPAPSPGAPGIGDPLMPLDGNGGYTVRRYTLDFDWQAPGTPFAAGTTISATATQALSRFDLDFAGNTLHKVTVDGAPATAERDGDELVVTPAKPIPRGGTFTVHVAYTADPTQRRHRDDAIREYGWVPTPDGTVVCAQPDGAKMIFPADDHPSLRAPFTFHITTPPGLSAVANGRLVERVREPGGRVQWTYDSEEPIAAQLVQLAIGKLTFVAGRGPGGRAVRDVVPDDLVADTEAERSLTPEHLAWLEQRLGPYPFRSYGVLVGDTDLPVALETQSLSLVPKDDLLGDRVDAERNLVHELTHHWTGDSVAVRRWSDLWLSEGHARFYERLYSEEHGGVSMDDAMRAAYEQHDQWRHDDGAPAEPTEPTLFKVMRYDGSALVLYALREKVGDETFGRIERAWVTEYRGRAAGTKDFVALASRVAGKDLTPFLTPWLYGPHTPPMPGHPDWHVDPVED
ncbi:peptidase M1-like protein [Streptomyces sp. Ag109_O5-1]|uniref:M1 family metallopeptidase n=1 Tax=Streptomyces sp. Ag109_O5-1 TaxID=1938851 RepID=UPI000F993C8C|nr:M1 family metallopeptidase [Streptomyces sp. Ag109_O5-1]RPE45840.1 peptidase M1-like protein [Streptomyces sp. Ag109_O5-1]